MPTSTGTQCAHSLEGELAVVGLDAADVVRRGGVQRLHEQVQRGAELGAQTGLVTEAPCCTERPPTVAAVAVAVAALVRTANLGPGLARTSYPRTTKIGPSLMWPQGCWNPGERPPLRVYLRVVGQR